MGVDYEGLGVSEPLFLDECTDCNESVFEARGIGIWSCDYPLRQQQRIQKLVLASGTATNFRYL